MRWTAIAKRIDVILETATVRIDAFVAHVLFQYGDLVTSLSPRHNFLSPHEEIVAITQRRIRVRRVRVEGTK